MLTLLPGKSINFFNVRLNECVRVTMGMCSPAGVRGATEFVTPPRPDFKMCQLKMHIMSKLPSDFSFQQPFDGRQLKDDLVPARVYCQLQA